jgi:hypothetical protein
MAFSHSRIAAKSLLGPGVACVDIKIHQSDLSHPDTQTPKHRKHKSFIRSLPSLLMRTNLLKLTRSTCSGVQSRDESFTAASGDRTSPGLKEQVVTLLLLASFRSQVWEGLLHLSGGLKEQEFEF